MATDTKAYAVPAQVLAAVEQLVRGACGSLMDLNVTGLELPAHIVPTATGPTQWAPTRLVAEWVRDELRRVPVVQ